MHFLQTALALAAAASTASAHLVLTYPGSRGNSLHTNGTYPDDTIIPGSLGINYNKTADAYTFPYGMEWMYPCGGLPTSSNRTGWPVSGGAVAFQPGWFSGHLFALIYVNLGIGTEPLNMSHPMVPPFQIAGPSNSNYSGSVCLPQVSLPAGYKPNIGDNATIQVIETAQHGAALYSCVDITFVDDHDAELVTKDNCFNGTDAEHPNTGIGFNTVFTSKSLTNGAGRTLQSTTATGAAVAAGLALVVAGLL